MIVVSNTKISVSSEPFLGNENVLQLSGSSLQKNAQTQNVLCSFRVLKPNCVNCPFLPSAHLRLSSTAPCSYSDDSWFSTGFIFTQSCNRISVFYSWRNWNRGSVTTYSIIEIRFFSCEFLSSSQASLSHIFFLIIFWFPQAVLDGSQSEREKKEFGWGIVVLFLVPSLRPCIYLSGL